MDISIVDYNDEYYTVYVSFDGNPDVNFEFNLSDLEVLQEIIEDAKKYIRDKIAKNKEP